MIVGIPDWLTEIGLLKWLEGLDPLDKWLAILAAVFVGAYAIFHEEFWRWTRRPKLMAHPDLNCIGIPVNFPDKDGKVVKTADSFQVRLVIENRGKSRAESVEVFAKKLSQKDGQGRYAECEWFLPMNLTWANQQGPFTSITPKIERVCNLVGVLDPVIIRADIPKSPPPQAPESFDYRETCTLQIHTVVHTSSYSNWLYPGSYHLDLIVAAANADPQEVSICVSFDGRWIPEKATMLKQALRVSVAKASS